MTSKTGVGLRIQSLDRKLDQVIVIGVIVGYRNQTREFMPAQIEDMFDTLRAPRPGNVRQMLTTAATLGFATRKKNNRWAITPTGEERVRTCVGAIDVLGLEAELAVV